GVDGSRHLLNIVFVLVVLFTLIQGRSLPAVAHRLSLTRPGALRDIQVETAPLDVLDADLLTVAIPPGSHLKGVAAFELRLPPPTVVTLIIRDGTTLVPNPDTVLRTGDELLLITTPASREAAERRLRAIDRRGKLARWHGEHGNPEPTDDSATPAPPGDRRPPHQTQPPHLVQRRWNVHDVDRRQTDVDRTTTLRPQQGETPCPPVTGQPVRDRGRQCPRRHY
ncbi:TrkA C-terminal domain-containing protein, partial [Streptomyces sp. NPDC005180]|uniref:TrkA C-terminal domain-containing protein n=1 Tax=Streptomyces sp. NPDC005180 TaxID=3156868 RepID=UPI0033B5F8A5